MKKKKKKVKSSKYFTSRLLNEKVIKDNITIQNVKLIFY